MRQLLADLGPSSAVSCNSSLPAAGVARKAWNLTVCHSALPCRYLGFLLSQAGSCAWAAHAVLPCVANPTRLLPWHTLFGVGWRVAISVLLLLGFLLPFLAYLIAQQLYLAATAQTARECFRR